MEPLPMSIAEFAAAADLLAMQREVKASSGNAAESSPTNQPSISF
jgi:hypothetical protein